MLSDDQLEVVEPGAKRGGIRVPEVLDENVAVGVVPFARHLGAVEACVVQRLRYELGGAAVSRVLAARDRELDDADNEYVGQWIRTEQNASRACNLAVACLKHGWNASGRKHSDKHAQTCGNQPVNRHRYSRQKGVTVWG